MTYYACGGWLMENALTSKRTCFQSKQALQQHYTGNVDLVAVGLLPPGTRVKQDTPEMELQPLK